MKITFNLAVAFLCVLWCLEAVEDAKKGRAIVFGVLGALNALAVAAELFLLAAAP